MIGRQSRNIFCVIIVKLHFNTKPLGHKGNGPFLSFCSWFSLDDWKIFWGQNKTFGVWVKSVCWKVQINNKY